MCLMSELKTFGYLAVNTLGMPAEVMPFYTDSINGRKRQMSIVVCVKQETLAIIGTCLIGR